MQSEFPRPGGGGVIYGTQPVHFWFSNALFLNLDLRNACVGRYGAETAGGIDPAGEIASATHLPGARAPDEREGFSQAARDGGGERIREVDQGSGRTSAAGHSF